MSPPTALRLAALTFWGASLAACSTDIFDVTVALAPHAFPADFGPPGGTIPTVACDPAMAGMCGARQVVDVSGGGGVPADVSVDVGCDPAKLRCFAQAHARVSYQLDVLQDDGFVTAVERRSISFVRMVDIAYTIPKNTLTFEIPKIDVYVGPAGAHAETDAGVVLVDSIPPISPGVTVVADPRHLTLGDASPARTLLETTIRDQKPFVFLLVTQPRLEAGSPVPAGAFELDIFPKVGLGFPR